MLNKLSFLTTCLIAASLAHAQQKPFSITGNIEGKSDAYIYLYVMGGEPGVRKMDSALITNGRFSFSGQLAGPAQAMLAMDKAPRGNYGKNAEIYLVPADMQLSLSYDSFEEPKLTGSPVQKEADELRKSKASVTAQIKPLSEAYNKANNTYIDAIRAKKDEATLASLKEAANGAKDAMDPLIEQLRKLDEVFMDKYPKSFITASMLRYRIGGMKLKEGQERYGKLTDDVKKSSLGKEIKKELDALQTGSPGAQAFVFASKELRGEPLSLADYKGKYVLLDFWASWCVPCRKGNPHLLSLYAKYKDKGFEIIGVSDDDSNPEAWQKAVDKDGIGVWKHVLRGLKRVDGPALFDRSASISDRYGIHTLPTKVLIDPNGIIIGRYGGGGENDEAMDRKLAEVFSGQAMR